LVAWLDAAMQVTTTYLEQTGPTDLRPSPAPAVSVRLDRVEPPDAALNRDLYAAVGRDWQWTDRAGWSLPQWQQRLDRPGGETWLVRVGAAGRPDTAGYVELESQVVDGRTEVEVAYFGLLPAFTGRGIGGHALTLGVRAAWHLHERWPDLPRVARVWLHTCSLDGPAALPNYLARGFRVTATTVAEQGG
jgi:GNAT superfamily N-acetyltransferase